MNDAPIDDLTDPLSPRKTDVDLAPPSATRTQEGAPVSAAEANIRALGQTVENPEVERAIKKAFALDPTDAENFRRQIRDLEDEDIFFTTTEVLEFVTGGKKSFTDGNPGRSSASGQTFINKAILDDVASGDPRALTRLRSEILHEVVARDLIRQSPDIAKSFISAGEVDFLKRFRQQFPNAVDDVARRRGVNPRDLIDGTGFGFD